MQSLSEFYQRMLNKGSRTAKIFWKLQIYSIPKSWTLDFFSYSKALSLEKQIFPPEFSILQNVIILQSVWYKRNENWLTVVQLELELESQVVLNPLLWIKSEELISKFWKIVKEAHTGLEWTLGGATSRPLGWTMVWCI